MTSFYGTMITDMYAPFPGPPPTNKSIVSLFTYSLFYFIYLPRYLHFMERQLLFSAIAWHLPTVRYFIKMKSNLKDG